MAMLRSLHQALRAAEDTLDKYMSMSDWDFMRKQVVDFLTDKSAMWTMFNTLIDMVSEIEKPVLEAQNGILQLVGIGDDWNRAEMVCMRFRELRQMLTDASLGAMEGRSVLQTLFSEGQLECLKW